MTDQHFTAEERDIKDFLAEGREDGLGDREAALPDAETREGQLGACEEGEGHLGACEGREWLSEAGGQAGALMEALLANGLEALEAGSGGGGIAGILEKAGAFGEGEAARSKGRRKRKLSASWRRKQLLEDRSVLPRIMQAFCQQFMEAEMTEMLGRGKAKGGLTGGHPRPCRPLGAGRAAKPKRNRNRRAEKNCRRFLT